MKLIDTYFFVPANKPRFIDKSQFIKHIDQRVFDLEDSVSETEVKQALELLKTTTKKLSDWVRVPLSHGYNSLLEDLLKIGFNKFIIPKIAGLEHANIVLNQIQNLSSEIKIIILVENAKIYLEMEQILNKWNDLIWGIGLGSHDFTASTNMMHNEEVLFGLRRHISLVASAYNIKGIDIASMNMSDETLFQNELREGFNLGYRSKFILHPNQIDYLIKYPFFTNEEVENAITILDKFNNLGTHEALFKFNGKIYEKPHIENLNTIKKWGINFYGSNR